MSSKLPPGRHGLTRDEVAEDQRGRLIVALGEAMAVKGFAGTTVADISRGAKVSKRTFYQHYDSKQACFMDAFARIHQRLGDSTTGIAAGTTPLEVFDELLGKYLETIARNAVLARIYLIEVYAAGPDALRIRMQLQQNTVDGIFGLFGADTEEGRFACRALVAAISSLVTHELVDSGPEGIRGLHAPLLGLTVRLLDP